MSCYICDEDFTSCTRKKITCINNECEGNYCLECFKNYLLKSPEYSQTCPICSASLSLKDIFSQCNSASFIKAIMEKVTSISLKNQKNLLPQSQPGAKIILNERAFEEWRKKESKKILDLYLEIRKIEEYIDDEKVRLCGSEALANLKKEKNHYTFIKQCSHRDCKGLLSTAWKCPLCEKFTCPACHEPKENNDHICNEDMVKNIEAVKKDSKPCPKCGTAISKLEGCDQMYCVSCHSAFSWRTGKLENGYIHNPEYFRYRRDNNLEIDRNPNEGRGFEMNDCFDPFDLEHRRQVEQYLIVKMRGYANQYGLVTRGSNLLETLRNMYRSAIHTKIIILDKYRINLEDNLEKLRISYLVGDIDEDKWNYEIKKKTKEYHRNQAQYEIINTFLKIWGDIIMNIIYIFEENEKVKEKIENQLNIYVKYLENTNKELKNARDIFKSKERSYFQLVKRYDRRLEKHPHEISFYINIDWRIN